MKYNLTGRALTFRGASNTHLSLDYGTFFLHADSGIVDPFNARRVTSAGVVGILAANGELEIEVPAIVSWQLDERGRASAAAASFTLPGGEIGTVRTTSEAEDSPLVKRLNGALLAA